ncbi:ParB/RepB/Spo0J family partition protein [Roseivivax sp. CAU 1761]
MTKKLSMRKPTVQRETAVSSAPEEPRPTAAEILHMDTSDVTRAPSSPHQQSRFNAVRARTIQQIFARQLVVEVPVELIEDAVGSDRSDKWRDHEDLKSLMRNIEQEGQKTPVDLRVLDEDWVPSGRDLQDIDEADNVRFAVQAGRRRIEACRLLGIKVKAFLSHGDPYADLRVRFFENTQRKDLSALDYYRSIGQLAAEMRRRTPEITNIQIGEQLGVNRTYVTIGERAERHAKTVAEMYPEDGGHSLTHEALRNILAELEKPQPLAEGSPESGETAVSSPSSRNPQTDEFEIGRQQEARPTSPTAHTGSRRTPPTRTVRFTGYTCKLETIRSGANITLRGGAVRPETMDRIAEAIEQIMREDGND